MPEAAKLPTGEPEESADAKPEEGAAEPPFANRAERRAKGKGKSSPHTHAQGKGFPAGRGSVQSPRQYGNRRSG